MSHDVDPDQPDERRVLANEDLRRQLDWGPPRDPNRIPAVLEALRTVWEQHPDWRLGQLIVNVTGRDEPFNFEDDELIEQLRVWVDRQ